MKTAAIPCAIYTRKSSEEGLEQGFNSLDAQREACAAYILSQKALGWVSVPLPYDDGGFSGGNVERPALQRLLDDIAARRVRVVVVYKVDRLTRSLADFAKMVELFDQHGVSFVSVTQAFNTTSSMGRLTLNVLLSFAQFEREVTGERIRDKIAASKRKGMWMGGNPPIGYVPKDRSLAIDEEQAERVCDIYRTYLELNCVRRLKAELDRRGWVTPVRITRRLGAAGGHPFSRGHLYRILSNPVYIGQIAHKGEVFAGNHLPIIDQELWQTVQHRLALNRQGHRNRVNATQPSLLVGLVFDDQGNRFTPSHSKKGARRYRYYVQRTVESDNPKASRPALRIPAQELEDAVMGAVVGFINDEQRWLTYARTVSAKVARDHLDHAKLASEKLRKSPAEELRRCVQRIQVNEVRIKIIVRLAAILEMEGDDAIHEIDVPMNLKRCGMAVKLIVHAPGAAATRVQNAKLVALLARAHDWLDRLTSGRSTSVSEIAQDEQVTGSYVARVIQVAFLAPDIVQRIARGDHSPAWNVQRLITELPLPHDWTAQRARLGLDL